MNDTEHSPDPNKPGSTRLLLLFLCTMFASVVTCIIAMMMALGTGLVSTPDDPVSSTSQILWGIGALSFIPCMILLVTLIGTHKRVVGITLGLTVITAGLLTAIGWFIASDGEMPNTTQGDVAIVLVVVVPLIAGMVLFAHSRSLKS